MILQLLTIATGLLVASFYLSFTLVIFPALTRMEAHRARTFMVHVNTYAQRPPFLSLFSSDCSPAQAPSSPAWPKEISWALPDPRWSSQARS